LTDCGGVPPSVLERRGWVVKKIFLIGEIQVLLFIGLLFLLALIDSRFAVGVSAVAVFMYAVNSILFHI
jgi:hypothetical protein